MYLPENITLKPTNDAIYFGIDLGTTYTLVATVNSKDVNLKNLTQIPVKFISYKQTSPIRHGGVVHDEKVASILAISKGKPFCGTKLYELKGHDEFIKNVNIFYHWKLDFGLERYPLYPDAISEKLNTPAKVAGKVLDFCRIGYTKNKDQKLLNTVITVPASFQMNQRKDVIWAANSANIELSNQMLIDEPNAAFIGHFNRLSQEENNKFLPAGEDSKRVLIFDIGGGTCDLSILEIGHHPKKGLIISNKAISRYTDIGGQDIDMLIAEDILYPMFLSHFNLADDMPYKDLTENILPQLSTIGEMLKVGLCNLISAKYPDIGLQSMNLYETVYSLEGRKITYNGQTYSFPPLKFSANDFKEILSKLFLANGYSFKYQDKFIRSIGKTINEILEKANLNKHDIDVILPVGGSSRNPMLIKRISEIIPKSKIWIPANPDKLVAEGAAIYSYFYHHFGKSLINAISSETIGIEVKGNIFYPLIEKGTELPIQIEMPNFTIQSANQKEVIIPVCLNYVENIVTEIKIPLEKMYKGDENVTISANLSEDKMLKLFVEIDGSEVLNYTLENPFFFGSLSQEQIKFVELSQELDKARRQANNRKEKSLIIQLLSQYFDIRNYHEVARLADSYLEKFDSEDTQVLNYSHIGNKHIGRRAAAKRALEKAIELDPNQSAFRYNYSLLVSETDGNQMSLEYLTNLPESIRADKSIQCRIVILKDELGVDVLNEAFDITQYYKQNPGSFSKFDVEYLLERIHTIAKKQFTRRIETKNREEREGKVLIASSKPIIIE